MTFALLATVCLKMIRIWTSLNQSNVLALKESFLEQTFDTEERRNQ